MPKPTVGTLLLAIAITITGCGSDDNGMNREEQFNQLMQRPSLEDVFEQYQRMRQEIADELTAKLGLPAWTQDDNDGGGSLCGHQFNDLGIDARTKSPPLLSLAALIPDEKWDQAVRIAEDIAGRNGFGPPQGIAGEAGHHLVDFKDTWGGRLSMGTMVHSSLSVRTGCHLTAEAKQRGTPTPLPEHQR